MGCGLLLFVSLVTLTCLVSAEENSQEVIDGTRGSVPDVRRNGVFDAAYIESSGVQDENGHRTKPHTRPLYRRFDGMNLNSLPHFIHKHRTRHTMKGMDKRFSRWRHLPSYFKCPSTMRMDRFGNCRYKWF